MISRLTAFAACFAVLSAATIAFAAGATAHLAPTVTVSTPTLAVVQFPQVQITGQRADASRP